MFDGISHQQIETPSASSSSRLSPSLPPQGSQEKTTYSSISICKQEHQSHRELSSVESCPQQLAWGSQEPHTPIGNGTMPTATAALVSSSQLRRRQSTAAEAHQRWDTLGLRRRARFRDSRTTWAFGGRTQVRLEDYLAESKRAEWAFAQRKSLADQCLEFVSPLNFLNSQPASHASLAVALCCFCSDAMIAWRAEGSLVNKNSAEAKPRNRKLPLE